MADLMLEAVAFRVVGRTIRIGQRGPKKWVVHIGGKKFLTPDMTVHSFSAISIFEWNKTPGFETMHAARTALNMYIDNVDPDWGLKK